MSEEVGGQYLISQKKEFSSGTEEFLTEQLYLERFH
jgi:hypothetical protein